MSAEVIYEIARYAVDANTEALLERAQIVVENGIMHRRVDDGPETVCEETDLHAVIAADPLLNEVRADQATRIDAEPSAAQALPFVLSVPGSGDDLNESLWSDAMWREHLEGTDSAGLRLLQDLRRSMHDPPTRLPQRNSAEHTETGPAPTDSIAIA